MRRGSGLGDKITKVLWNLVSKELGFSLGELGALGGSERRRTGPEKQGQQQGHNEETLVAGPGGGRGSDEAVERFWKPKEHSTNAFSDGPGIGVRESLAPALPQPQSPPPFLGPTSAMTVAQADISG